MNRDLILGEKTVWIADFYTALKREVLEVNGGFDEVLIAGEDPGLSYRIRQKGGKYCEWYDFPVTQSVRIFAQTDWLW